MTNQSSYETELIFAKELAKKAINIALSYYKKNPETHTKEDKSPVTVADEEINQLVINQVKATFPEHGVLGEEQSFSTDRETLWVCDPIDGTIAFSMGEPLFSFSLAMVVDGQPVVAVAADISTKRIFHAVKGQGAFIGGVPTKVSSRKMSEAWLAFPTNLKWLFKKPQMYMELSERVYQTNVIHGGVFKGLLIAEGLSDGSVWGSTVSPWDMAAVKLIVEEAGGKMTDKFGNDQLFNTDLNGVVVSNSVIHDELIEITKRNA